MTFRAIEVTSGKILASTTFNVAKFDYTSVSKPFGASIAIESEHMDGKPAASPSKATNRALPAQVGVTVAPLAIIKNKSLCVVKGQWSIDSGTLTPTSSRAVFGLPVEIAGSYAMDLEVFRSQGSEVIFLVLPVAKRQVYLELSSQRGKVNALSFVNGQHSDINGTASSASLLRNGVWNKVRVNVLVNGDSATVSCDIDQKSAINWSGDWRDLSTDQNWIPRRQDQIGIASVDPDVKFRCISVNGDVKPLQ